MTYVFGVDPAELPPLTIWEALKLAEDRSAFATVLAEHEPDVRIHVFGGRLLVVVDEDDHQIDLVKTIAELLKARRLCSLSPLCDIPDAASLPTLPIAESLVAAVRLKTASAKLGHDPELASGTIVATTFGTSADPEPSAEEDVEVEAEAEAEAQAEQEEDSTEQRKSEADRMREEFFKRRARGRGNRAAARVAPAPHPASATTIENRVKPPSSQERAFSRASSGRTERTALRVATDTDQSRRRSDRSGTEQHQSDVATSTGAEEPSRPTQRTALRSLIRSLVS